MRRTGYCGGEMEVKKNKIVWNLDSGSYTRTIIRNLRERGAQYRQYLIQGISKIWNVTSCASRFEFNERRLPKIVPSKTYIHYLCKIPGVSKRIIHTGTNISVCEKYECD